MKRTTLTCEAAGGGIGRRSILLGLAGLATAVSLREGRANTPLRISDLVTADGEASERARALAGGRVTLRGYLAPALSPDAPEIVLTEGPALPCQLCGAQHDAGASIPVRPAAGLAQPSMLQLVEVTGQVEVGGGAPSVRLVGAHLAPV